jgi:hypothetical protein
MAVTTSGWWSVSCTCGEATRRLPGHEDGYFQGEAVIVDAHDTYVLLTPREMTWLFSVLLETVEVDCGHERNKYAGPAYPWELPLPVHKLWSPIKGRIDR